MLIEIRDDPADRGFDDALVVDGIDVLAPHAVDDLGDERSGFDRWIERGRRGFGSPREGSPDRASQCQPKPEHDAGEQHDYAAESQGHLLLLAFPRRPAATLARACRREATAERYVSRGTSPARRRLAIHGCGLTGSPL